VQDWTTALVDYQAAYDAEPLPAFLFNIGQCHKNLAHYEKAIFFFGRDGKLAPVLLPGQTVAGFGTIQPHVQGSFGAYGQWNIANRLAILSMKSSRN